VVVFSLVNNSLAMLEEKISNFDKAKIEFFQQVAQCKEKAPIEGVDVFRYLKETVLKKSQYRRKGYKKISNIES